MFVFDDADCEALIDRLGAPLQPAQREAFRQAAFAALAQMPCMGEGIAYRTLSGLFRQYFDPPCLVHRAPPSHPGASKAINQPPLGRTREWVRSRRIG